MILIFVILAYFGLIFCVKKDNTYFVSLIEEVRGKGSEVSEFISKKSFTDKSIYILVYI